MDGPDDASGKYDFGGRVQPCVRPVCAARGLLALMKSADWIPDHLCALLLRLVPSGLSSPRPDRFAIIYHHSAHSPSSLLVFDEGKSLNSFRRSWRCMHCPL